MEPTRHWIDERRVIGLVWRRLDTTPDERPSVGRVASLVSRTARQFRRDWRHRRTTVGSTSIRCLITYACLQWGWQRIGDGVKCGAASRMAGFHSHWNFNRQTKKFSGCTACACRSFVPAQFSSEEIALALAELDAEIAGLRLLERRKERRRCDPCDTVPVE